jgi:hypothetical protein
MMARTQICLDSELQRGAREKANALGISLAEYVRRLIDRDIGTRRLTVSPSNVFDLGSSGGSNVARNKKAMLGEAVAARDKRASKHKRRSDTRRK